MLLPDSRRLYTATFFMLNSGIITIGKTFPTLPVPGYTGIQWQKQIKGNNLNLREYP